MGGPGSGRKKGSKNRPGTRTISQIAGDPRNVDPETNRAAIMFGKVLFGLEGPDLSDADAVLARWYQFLDLCAEAEMRPMVTGMAMAFNVPNSHFRAVVYGVGKFERYKGITPASRAILQKGYEFLQFSYEYAMAKDVHNPAKYIFLMKNYFGYTDASVQVNVDLKEAPALGSADDVADRYRQMMGRPTPMIEAEVLDVEDPGDPEADPAGDSGDSSDSRGPADPPADPGAR